MLSEKKKKITGFSKPEFSPKFISGLTLGF